MPVSSYPRVTVQGTGTAQNTQNGQALMIVNPSTGQYEAATAATFGGGGGGGDATAANQSTQITEAQTANTYLGDVSNYLFDGGSAQSAAELLNFIKIYTYESASSQSIAELLYSSAASESAASLLNNINNTLTLINTELGNIKNELISLNTAVTDGTQLVQITDSAGIKALVDATDKALNVKSF